MSSEQFRLDDYVGHILDAISKIKTYTSDGRDEFFGSTLHQDAVVRNLEIIGEASRSILHSFPEFVAAHPDVPLRNAYAMRNVLSHGYFNIDLEIVWNTVQSDLGVLSDKLTQATQLPS